MDTQAFINIREKELLQFEKQLKIDFGFSQDENLDKIHLLLLFKLFQTEKRVNRLEKHLMTPLIH